VKTQSIIRACQLKFATLDAANFPGAARPRFDFDETPQVDENGAQIRVEGQTGCVVLIDRGQDVKLLNFELTTREVANFDIEVYYESLADVDQAVYAIKRNPPAGADESFAPGRGFDFGKLPDLFSPRGTFVIRRVREQRSRVGLNRPGKPVHCCRINYRVEILEQF
jgi:hypothetical protein